MMFVASSALDMSIINYNQDGENMNPSGRTDEEVMGMYEKWLVKHGKKYNALGKKRSGSRYSRTTLDAIRKARGVFNAMAMESNNTFSSVG
ncbi:hypothetical protein RJ641_032156 [Dillenia turbinata]|uniref:Uncharacterized protein n=1 Tax=Dillenia turbinata TaxID=194707 RepID=A0AAN8VP92_9MAGN